MKKISKGLVLGLMLATGDVLIGAATANAMPMTTGRTTSQPIGHYEFCQQVPQECRATGNYAPDRLTQRAWAKMVEINARVNATIAPRTELEMLLREEISGDSVRYGDCEDYALQKRHELIQAGFHTSNLLITVVLQPNGDGHAVLTVRTDRGDFILDNLVSKVLDWRDTRYRYLKRQSTANAGKWVDIIDDRPNIVAGNF